MTALNVYLPQPGTHIPEQITVLLRAVMAPWFTPLLRVTAREGPGPVPLHEKHIYDQMMAFMYYGTALAYYHAYRWAEMVSNCF